MLTMEHPVDERGAHDGVVACHALQADQIVARMHNPASRTSWDGVLTPLRESNLPPHLYWKRPRPSTAAVCNYYFDMEAAAEACDGLHQRLGMGIPNGVLEVVRARRSSADPDLGLVFEEQPGRGKAESPPRTLVVRASTVSERDRWLRLLGDSNAATAA